MSKIPEPVHCRLFFLLARTEDMGVIFRRGPSKWVQVIRWDTASDTFEPGQWFHGRIYERRCDLSPDGSLMIYFVSKFSGKTLNDKEYTYAWTAISRPPYLTALALWPKGDCWDGGGIFKTNTKVRLNHAPYQAVPHPDHMPQGIEVTDTPNAHGEDYPIFAQRLERDGWILEQPFKFKSYTVTEQSQIYRKNHPFDSLSLVMTTTYEPRAERIDYALRHPQGETPVIGAECADWDLRGRLVFAREGKLFTTSLNQRGELDEQELADFDAARFSPIAAPDWATQW